MVEERARVLLVEGKAAEQRAELARLREKRFDDLRAAVEKARAGLEAHWMPPRNPGKRVLGVPSVGGLLRMFVLLSAVYAAFHLVAIPYLDWTPAGWACPMVCEGCTASARVIHYAGTQGDSEVDEVAVCRNRDHDVDRETLGAIMSGSRLDPYRMSSVTIIFVECGMWLALMMPLLSILVRRRGWVLRGNLEQALAKARADLRAAKKAEQVQASSEPYR